MILVFGHNLISHFTKSEIRIRLHGSIRVNVYNKHTKDSKATPIKIFDLCTDDVTWIDRNWYQTHQLQNVIRFVRVIAKF
jgi:hypothetical protein